MKGSVRPSAGGVEHARGKVSPRALEGVHRERELANVVLATRPPGRLACGLDRRQEQADEHADDGDDDEQLDEREGPRGATIVGGATGHVGGRPCARGEENHREPNISHSRRCAREMPEAAELSPLTGERFTARRRRTAIPRCRGFYVFVGWLSDRVRHGHIRP